MGDAPARTELKVTTGPIRGSRKVHVGPLQVAMRAVDLEPSSGEPPVVLYDTSGPYTDSAQRIDIMAGLPELRADIRPREGLMVLFPGWLSHSVEPWQGGGERISVAMNVRVAHPHG
jgi:hypothetical protein